MVFSELPVGSKFCFGKIKKTQYNYGRNGSVTQVVDTPLIWKKTALNGLSVGVDECGYCSFDYPRQGTGNNRYMRSHGHRLFFLSSLYKYLNCADGSWRETAVGDGAPYSDSNNSGFLSRFTDEELRLIEPHNMRVAVPAGYTKQYGTEMTKSVLVGIPSLEQVGDRLTRGTFGVSFDRISTWVSDADTMCKYLNHGYLRRTGGDGTSNIMPVIKLKDDAPVDMDESGRYIIRIPETNFTGDLDAFLGLQFEAAA